MDDLVERLHILAKEAGIENLPIAETLGQAASRIRELEREVERLTKVNEHHRYMRANLAPSRDAALADNERLRGALKRASIHLSILTGRMRACHEETKRHELIEEAEGFCAEAVEALKGDR